MTFDRTQFRRQANKADNKAATVAVDSLMNFEAVKVLPPPIFVSVTFANPFR